MFSQATARGHQATEALDGSGSEALGFLFCQQAASRLSVSSTTGKGMSMSMTMMNMKKKKL